MSRPMISMGSVLGKIPDALLGLQIPGVPYPFPRPGQRRDGKRYSPSALEDAKRTIGYLMVSARNRGGGRWDDRRTFGVAAVFHGARKGDVDNLVKTVLDAGTGILWGDDQQVIEIRARVRREGSPPRSELLLYEPVP